MTEEQKEQVKKILLMPIECTRHNSPNIFIDNDKNRIVSSQTYYSSLDPDMSDIAIAFYRTIYGKEILDGKYFKSKEFCGDTMNTYNTVAKKMGNEKAKEKWHNQYHCLANFWLLPMSVGRSLGKYSKAKNGINDYMDKFLHYYRENYKEYLYAFPEYAKEFTLDNFARYHFLEESYIYGKNIDDFSDANADNIPCMMWDKIRQRANRIVCRKKRELYELFKNYI